MTPEPRFRQAGNTAWITRNAPSVFVSDLVDPYAFTVIAKSSKTKAVLAKASCKTNPEGEIVAFRTLKIS